MAAVAAAQGSTADGSVLGPWDVALGDVAAGRPRAGVLLERTKSAHAAIAATTTTAVPIVANDSQPRCIRLGSVDVLAMTLASLFDHPEGRLGVDLDVVRVRRVARESLEVCWSAAEDAGGGSWPAGCRMPSGVLR